jgi:diadenosine tetraphosphatase ApaH/serine/threonine PP2A family protein phosphatase
MVTNVLAFGHLHVPFIRQWEGYDLVNVSSVSMPGDGDPRAKYAVFDWDGKAWTVEHRHVEYDVEEEIAAFRESQPPGWETSVASLEEKGMIPQVV